MNVVIMEDKLIDWDLMNELKKMGYKFLVLQMDRLVAFPRMNKTADDTLTFLGMKEYEIDTMSRELVSILQLLNVVVRLDDLK